MSHERRIASMRSKLFQFDVTSISLSLLSLTGYRLHDEVVRGWGVGRWGDG